MESRDPRDGFSLVRSGRREERAQQPCQSTGHRVEAWQHAFDFVFFWSVRNVCVVVVVVVVVVVIVLFVTLFCVLCCVFFFRLRFAFCYVRTPFGVASFFFQYFFIFEY